MQLKFKSLLAASAALTVIAGLAGAARADAPAAPAAAPAPPPTWASTIKVSGHLEVGVTANFDDPKDGLNFGQLFTDRSNQPLLNSFALNVERDPDTSSKTVDIGFKVQAAYGSDSRYTETIGILNKTLDSRNQLDIVEGHVDAHLPYLTAGGMEVHAGILPTLEGVEVMDPTGNFFYSKSYLFNFGIPLKYTGIMTETHISPMYDLYLGIDSGVNTSLGNGGGANDGTVHFHGGIGVNLKNVTILATTQIGPEDYTYNSLLDYLAHKPTGVSGKNRYLNDAVVTWKVNDKLTSTTDINYAYDDLGYGKGAGAGGVTEYLAYTLSPSVTLGARAEIWRDDHNFFVGEFPSAYGYHDFVYAEGGYGFGAAAGSSASNVTYSEITLGVNYKPQGLPKRIDGLTFRPELRFDKLLTNGKSYDGFTKDHQITFGFDIVAPFSLL